MSKYVVVSFLEDVISNGVFTKSDWFLHMTLLPPFSTEVEEQSLIDMINKSVKGCKSFVLTGKSRELFGPEENIPVTTLTPTKELQEMHTSIKKALKNKIIFKSEQYTHFIPHVSDQKEKRISIDENVYIHSISLVKLDTTIREVVSTMFLK